MRGEDVTEGPVFNYISLEERVPTNHPHRRTRLLWALLLKVLYTVRSER